MNPILNWIALFIFFLFFFQNELKELKKKMRSTEEELKKVQTENAKYLNTITHVYNRVSPIAKAASEPAAAAAAAGSDTPTKETPTKTTSDNKEMQNGKSATPEAK